MSLLSSVGGFLATKALPFLGGAATIAGGLGAIFGGGGAGGGLPATTQAGVLPGAGRLGGMLGRAGTRALPALRRAAPVLGTVAASGAVEYVLDKFGNVKAKRRYRRMNVCNVRALRRSLRRIEGFEHVARRVLSITHHKKVGTRFKRRRKRS
jgi:hypothetical protein